jgi:hypothetical protein
MGELTSPKRVQEELFFTPLPTRRLLPAAESPESVNVLGKFYVFLGTHAGGLVHVGRGSNAAAQAATSEANIAQEPRARVVVV